MMEKLNIICDTIQRNNLDLIAFQELRHPPDDDGTENAELTMMRNMLNEREREQETQVQWECAGSGRTGRMFAGSECAGFLWCRRRPGLPRLTMTGQQLVINNNINFTRSPFIGYFKVNGLKFAVVNVHLKAQETGENRDRALMRLQSEIQSLVPLIRNGVDRQHYRRRIILLGDFNIDARDANFQGLRMIRYTNLIPEGQNTNFTNTEQYDNIWVRKDQWGYDDESHIEWGVIRDGLTNERNEPVSDHCPVWASI